MGMIRTFNAIAALDTAIPKPWPAASRAVLVATATGLVIAISTLVLYNFFTSKVDSLVIEMEKNALRTLRFLKRD